MLGADSMTLLGYREQHGRERNRAPQMVEVLLQIMWANALPSEKAGIKGPSAGSNHCQGCTEGSQQYANPRIIGVREDVSQLNERREASDKRSP